MEGESYVAHVLFAVILASLELHALDPYYCLLHTERFFECTEIL